MGINTFELENRPESSDSAKNYEIVSLNKEHDNKVDFEADEGLYSNDFSNCKKNSTDINTDLFNDEFIDIIKGYKLLKTE